MTFNHFLLTVFSVGFLCTATYSMEKPLSMPVSHERAQKKQQTDCTQLARFLAQEYDEVLETYAHRNLGHARHEAFETFDDHLLKRPWPVQKAVTKKLIKEFDRADIFAFELIHEYMDDEKEALEYFDTFSLTCRLKIIDYINLNAAYLHMHEFIGKLRNRIPLKKENTCAPLTSG